jgi:hypothetical protein
MVLHQVGGGVQGEAGLAAPTGTGQGHQPLLPNQPVTVASSCSRPMNDVNTAGRLGDGIERPERREVGWQAGAVTCHTRSAGQVLQAHRAQVGQVGVARIVGHQRRRRRRQQDLAAVGAGPVMRSG